MTTTDLLRLQLASAEAGLERARRIIRARLGAATTHDYERRLLAEGIDQITADALARGNLRVDIRQLERRVARLRNQVGREERRAS